MAVLNNAVPGAVKRKRLVRVMIVDTDPNVPASESVIYREELFTDTTNEGLKLSLNFGQALDTHNKKRVTFHRETQEGNKINLKPLDISEVAIRITDVEVF